jgi:hypothetical protein
MVDAEVGDEFRDLACTLTGIPAGSRIHYLLYQDPNEPSGKILLVHFFGLAAARIAGAMHPSRLGVALYTHTTRDIAALQRRLTAVGAKIEHEPREVDGSTRMLVRGPNAELFEFIASA